MPLFQDHSRDQLRRMYVETWRKSRVGEPLEPLEEQIARVLAEHPEYHALLDAPDATLAAEFPPETGNENPFLHLGLHLAIRDQVSTDRPPGTARVHTQLCQRLGSAHAAEHRMLEALAETLWEAGRRGAPPDESAYLERLKRLLGGQRP
jgi:hypothetical protein